MTKAITLILLPCLFPSLALADSDCAESATLADHSDCAAKEYRMLDRELNKVYQELVSMPRKDPEYVLFVQKLKEAQRAWLRFRDTHMTSVFTDDHKYSGTVENLCQSNELQRLTADRIKQLKAFLTIEEGDICGNPIVLECPPRSDAITNHSQSP